MFLMQWYRVQALLYKQIPQVSNACWHCQWRVGSLSHIFWECSLMCLFWAENCKRICQLTLVNLGENPIIYLLHINAVPLKQY